MSPQSKLALQSHQSRATHSRTNLTGRAYVFPRAALEKEQARAGLQVTERAASSPPRRPRSAETLRSPRAKSRAECVVKSRLPRAAPRPPRRRVQLIGSIVGTRRGKARPMLMRKPRVSLPRVARACTAARPHDMTWPPVYLRCFIAR